ncbi:hypothetical protein [Burkholderia stagnalis]|uniref:hypothetical protein n=1 Tax=Burkholderia stagnalis TaxID=1503054 RepID=UPI000F58A835|nr:hypothetical protein [Burkholderia stagnalis]RQR20356.1 hypothetical protein DF026_17145 [Burkholderia stagnalis]
MIEKGTRVKVRESRLEGYLVEFQRKLKGRVGVVTGHLRGREKHVSLVTFPAEGRKKEYVAGSIHNGDLEIVED